MLLVQPLLVEMYKMAGVQRYPAKHVRRTRKGEAATQVAVEGTHSSCKILPADGARAYTTECGG